MSLAGLLPAELYPVRLSWARVGSAGTDAIGINLDGFGWTWL